MAGIITSPQLAAYQEAAVKYAKELLVLPLEGAKSTLQFMTGYPNVRYKLRVGAPEFDAQFGPYDPTRRNNTNLVMNFRDLETQLGSVIADFDPNQARTPLNAEGATKGDGLKDVEAARLVLQSVAASLSFHLNNAIWSGVRNASGTTTADLFDGLDTITSNEITAGNISAAKGNYKKLSAALTSANADQIIKEEILFALDPHLRAQECYMYCSYDVYDKYCEAYQANHGGIVYNDQYKQRAVEGSDGKLIFVPLSNKSNSSFIHVAPKSNVIYGYDLEANESNVAVKEYAPMILSFVATLFFGVQFRTLDKRGFKAIELF